MKKVAVAAALALCGFIPHARAQTAPSTPLIQAENAFTVDLYSKLRLQPGNLFFSPYSISTAVGMLYAGAKGGTADQIAKMLHLNILAPSGTGPDIQAAFHQALKQQPALASAPADGFKLQNANALWLAAGYDIRPSYETIVKHGFGAKIARVDFSDAAGASGRINNWVEQQTENKIKNLIGPAMLGAATRMVLTNAIYLNRLRKPRRASKSFMLQAAGR